MKKFFRFEGKVSPTKEMGEGDKDNDVDGDHGGGPPPTQQSAMSEEKTITDLVLGVGNWWCLKQGKDEVVILVKRHFGNEEVFQSNLVLAAKCDLARPIKHNVSVARPAIDASADDLVTNMKNLVDSVKLPIIDFNDVFHRFIAQNWDIIANNSIVLST